MTIAGIEQVKRGAETEPIDYEALAAKCLADGTAGFKVFATFDADASYRLAHGKKPRVAGEESDDDKDKTQGEKDKEQKEEEEFNARKMLKHPPKELNAIETYEDDADFISHWIAYIIGIWREQLKDEESEVFSGHQYVTFKNQKLLKKTEEWLRPLITVLQKKTVSDQIYGNLREIALKCQVSEYKDAQKIYVQMMVGNVKWHTDQCHGEARHNKGFNFRKVEADEGARLYDDEAVNHYCLAIKRLMSVSQCILPHEDISNHV